MRILVTGGYGFIGSHVLRLLLEEGCEVGCLDRAGPGAVAAPVEDRVTYYRADVRDPVGVYGALADFQPEHIVHLASLLSPISQRDPRQAFSVNVTGSMHLLEAADHLDVERVVFASSVSAYGTGTPGAERLNEESLQRPTNMYGLTKYVIERVGPIYQQQRELSFVALEPVHGLGPDRTRGNVEDAYVVKAAVSGTPITVPNMHKRLEIIDVEDTARAFVRAVLAESVPRDRYLVGTGQQVSFEAFVDMVKDEVPGARLEADPGHREDELPVHPPTDCRRIREDLGWEPRHSVRETIHEYVRWLEENSDQWSFQGMDRPW